MFVCVRGNFVCHESFSWLFRLIRKCQLPLRTSSSLAFIENYRGHIFCLYTESFRRPFFNNNCNILILKGENTTFENRIQLLEKLRIFWTNGKVTQKFLAFLKLWKFLGNICSFKQLFFRIQSLGDPERFFRLCIRLETENRLLSATDKTAIHRPMDHTGEV